MDQERPSGELEGIILGSSSRDGSRGSKSQGRTHSSSGFLVDSSLLPRSKSLRSSYHRPRRPEPDPARDRKTPEVDGTPKKRSRLPWSRHRGSLKETTTNNLNSPIDNVAPGPSRPRRDAAVHEPRFRNVSTQAADIGLDKDSLQIVNLALNLSQSRRRTTIGYSTSKRISGGMWGSPDGHSPVPSSSLASTGPRPHRNFSQTFGDDHMKHSNYPELERQGNEPSAVVNYLPHSAALDSLPQGVSGSTLARAAKARRHFELFYEYLRLLPSLPPLITCDLYSTPDTSLISDVCSQSHRAYNPLQSIRNRKVRFRERCPIDTDADGWTDVGKVHTWINSVEARYSQQTHTPFECLVLPPFHRGQKIAPSHDNQDDGDVLAASPPSSLRRVSHTGNLKTRRPISDWVISPDELLADAAWGEEAQNKSKIVDKDGNNLYMDPRLLVVNDPYQEQTQLNRDSVALDKNSPRASLSDTRPRLSADFQNLKRGRQPRRPRSPYRVGHSSSASAKGLGLKRHKLGIRSRSSSSSSSIDDALYGDSLVQHLTPSKRSISPYRRKAPNWNRFDEKRGSMSSIPSADDRYDPLSLAMIESRASNTAMDISYFPSIASNLSAPSSRSPSPPKRAFSRAIGSRRDQSRMNSPQRKAKETTRDSSPESDAAGKVSVGVDAVPVTRPEIESTSLTGKTSTPVQEGSIRSSPLERREPVLHESRLRGIFKGPGKIAGKVGTEVSKMGDFILKKDTSTNSRKSSFATTSDSSDSEDEIRSEKRRVSKAILRRFPTRSDDASRSSPRNSDKSLTKNNIPSHSKDEQDDGRKLFQVTTSSDAPSGIRGDDNTMLNGKDFKKRLSGYSSLPYGERRLEFGPELHTIREEIKKGQIRDPSIPFSLARPPITGLAQAQPITATSSHDRRPTMPGQSRTWSISDRSISSSIDSGVPGKREIERTRALLLSSGIKAREITRRAESIRSPPPEFLRRSFVTDTSVPPVVRLYEHDLASQNILKRIEVSHNLFQKSLSSVPKAKFSPLRSRLTMLEELVNETLNPRVHAAAQEAENLSIQLNTTSTLAVKQLSDTLDKGIRRRHRRLRWLRRTGFVMLEWTLVGILWWVWLIVVAFKLLRKLSHGLVSGVRWVLWL